MNPHRVNPRGIPKTLAGRPVTRDQLEALWLRIKQGLPPNPLARTIEDLLAEAYMMGVIDAAGQRTEAARSALNPQDAEKAGE